MCFPFLLSFFFFFFFVVVVVVFIHGFYMTTSAGVRV